MDMNHKLRGVSLAMAVAGLAGLAQAGPVTDAMLAKDAGDSWLHANGNWQGHRYSTLNQINEGNAKDLKAAWIFQTGGKTDAQNTPLYHDGMVFFAQDNKVYALNADNGRIVWKYEHKLPEDWGGYNVGFITGKHRGLAIYGDNIYFLSNDAKLHAIDSKTGAKKFVKDYQEDGFPYPKDFAKAKDATGYAITIGPTAIPGTIIVPMNGTDFGGLAGYVLGVDPANGNIQWKAAMIPGAAEPGADSWPEGSTKY